MTVYVNRAGYGATVTTEDKFGNTRTYRFLPSEFGVRATEDGYTSAVLKGLWQCGVVVDWCKEDISGPVDVEDLHDVSVVETTDEHKYDEFL